MKGDAKGVVAGVILGVAALAALALLPILPSCRKEPPQESNDAALGKWLAQRYECARCHTGVPEIADAPSDAHCTTCHAEIVSGKASFGSADERARWATSVAGIAEVPSLVRVGERFDRAWIAAFLQRPTHLRPALPMHMPRLEIAPDQARLLAAYLAPEGRVTARDARPEHGRVDRGRAAFERHGCATCHVFSGATFDAGARKLSVELTTEALRRGLVLAPDLRVTRERMSRASLVAWLRAPGAEKSGTPMPDFHLGEDEARDLAAFVLDAPLAPVAKKPFEKLPVLERPVSFDEVDARVFQRICRHCHADRVLAMFAGGPGASGGFGFPARKLDLSTYRRVRAGIASKKPGEGRVDVVAPENPLLVQALVARHAEEAGAPTGPVRGMPLGFPPLPAEDIQLVETWIAQGAKR